MTTAEAAQALAKALNDWEESTGCTMACDGNSLLQVWSDDGELAQWVDHSEYGWGVAVT